MNYVNEYIEANKERFLNELFSILRIQSVSSQPEHKHDMLATAELLRGLLIDAGVDYAEVCPSTGNPVVYAEKMINPALPTILVYGHYDVMPADPVDQWLSPPFEPCIREGKIYARGADDDKGQSFMHIKAFELLVRTATLPCNLKFMIEGEEEIGSPALITWCAENRNKLKADVIVVSDTSMIDTTIPSITVGLRGLCYMEVEVSGPSRDLHSGLFGGAVANPINILCKLIASLHDEDGRVKVKDFYRDVTRIGDDERQLLARAPFNLQQYKESISVPAVWGEVGYSTMERTGIRPTLDVNGIWGGYTGEGSKTVIPAKAHAKISMRLVPNQDHHRIAELFQQHFEEICPHYVNVKVTAMHGGQPYLAPLNSEAYRAAHRALTETFGVEPVPVRSGGSIPIIATFEQTLGIKSILMGFGLESDAIHSPNESFPLFNFYKGIESIALFYKYAVEEYAR